MKVTVYDRRSGAITRCVQLFDRADAPLQVREGESWLEGHSDPNYHVVSEGKIVSKSPDDIEDFEVAQAWVSLRVERDARLKSSDWTQVPDAPVDQPAWATYRQELRNLPQNTDDPRQVVWPTPPTP